MGGGVGGTLSTHPSIHLTIGPNAASWYATSWVFLCTSCIARFCGVPPCRCFLFDAFAFHFPRYHYVLFVYIHLVGTYFLVFPFVLGYLGGCVFFVASWRCPSRPSQQGRWGIFGFGTAEATLAFGSLTPPPHGRGGSFTLGSPSPPPHGLGGFHLVWAHGMGVGASFALRPPRPPPHVRGGLLRFGIIEAPPALAWAPLSWLDPRGPLHMGAGPPSLWNHRGPLPPHGRWGPLRVRIIEAAVPTLVT